MRRIVKLRHSSQYRESMRINIPIDVQKELGWTHGMMVMITTDKGTMIVTKEDE